MSSLVSNYGTADGKNGANLFVNKKVRKNKDVIIIVIYISCILY